MKKQQQQQQQQQKNIPTSTQLVTSSAFNRSQSVNTLIAGISFWPATAFSRLDSTQSRSISVLDATDDSKHKYKANAVTISFHKASTV